MSTPTAPALTRSLASVRNEAAVLDRIAGGQADVSVGGLLMAACQLQLDVQLHASQGHPELARTSRDLCAILSSLVTEAGDAERARRVLGRLGDLIEGARPEAA